jgi:glycosyltransferase involved in cell wall biosynthesis
MRQIVCLSTANWHPFPTRKQQVMGRIAGGRILYFEPPVTYASPLKDPSAKPRLRAYRDEGEAVAKWITAFASPPVLPLYNRYRVINKLNQRRMAAYVKKKMADHGFVKPILWCYSPVSCDILDLIPHSAVVYDCVDRHAAYPGQIDPDTVNRMEAELCKRADVVFCTAKGLYDDLKPHNEATFLVPNGANFEQFHRAAEDADLPFPADLFNVKNPILGFVGMLQECIDTGLVLAAAERHPEWTFVFVGDALPGVDLTELKTRKNIRLLGLKPHKTLPQYLARFDVCLNLFKAGDLSRDVSPLKFYEYLATGRPIVSTPQPEQVMDYTDVVYIAGTPEEFIECCRRAIGERDAWKKRQRIGYGRAASWDARVADMETILKARGVFQ